MGSIDSQGDEVYMSPCTKGKGVGETSKEKGSDSQEYEKSQCLVNKILDGLQETMGHEREVLTDSVFVSTMTSSYIVTQLLW